MGEESSPSTSRLATCLGMSPSLQSVGGGQGGSQGPHHSEHCPRHSWRHVCHFSFIFCQPGVAMNAGWPEPCWLSSLLIP